MTNKSKEITYFSLFLQVLFGCIYPDMCIAYSFGFVWLHFSGHVHCINFGYVFFGKALSHGKACCICCVYSAITLYYKPSGSCIFHSMG